MRNSQVHSLQVYKGKLYAGTWPDGYVCRYEGGIQWTDCGRLGLPPGVGPRPINEVNDLTVYNGKLYAGVIPKAEVYRYEGGKTWTMMRRLISNADWSPNRVESWSRAPSLTEFNGSLYAGTASCRGFAMENAPEEIAHVYAFTAGRSVSYDRGLEPGWKHLVATREGPVLKMYVDGKLASTSSSFLPEVYDTSNTEVLSIGFGAIDHFKGTIDDLRIYNRALDANNVTKLSQEPGD